MSSAPYDFLVLGTGIAGLVFSLRVASHGKVAILTKKKQCGIQYELCPGGDRFRGFSRG